MFWKKKTKIVVDCDAGFPNTVYLRGEGIPHLNWEKGVPLENVEANKWVFETDDTFEEGQFKVLINDQVYELGDNHPIYKGDSVRIEPKFPNT